MSVFNVNSQRLIVSTALGAVFACLPHLNATAATLFSANITGDQEVPNPVVTDANGTATLTLNDAQDQLAIDIQIFGLDLDGNQTPSTDDNVTGLHIHRAPAGSNGPVVFGLISPSSDTNNDLVVNAVAGTVSSIWDLNEGNNTTLQDELSNLFAGNLYINVHTVAFPGGEIRGQIQATPEHSSVITLLGLGLIGVSTQLRKKSL